VRWYQKKHSPNHTYPDHQPTFTSFLQLLRQHPPCSIYVPDSLCAFPLSRASLVYLVVWNLHFILHTFFTQSLSSFCNTYPYHHNLFCCGTKIMSSIPSLSLSTLLNVTHPSDHSHLCPLKCHLIFFPSILIPLQLESFYGSSGVCLGLPG